MSTYTGFDMAPSALRWFVRDGTGSAGEAGGPIYGIRGCPKHPDYDSAVSWSDAMAFRQSEFEEKFESGIEKTVRYELPEGHASEWLRSFFQSATGHPAVDVNGTIAVAVPDHASPEDRDDVLAGLSATKYANVSLIWRPVAALLGWMESMKNEEGFELKELLGRRIFVLDLDAGRPELTELKCVRHRRHRDWIVPSRSQPLPTSVTETGEFERKCYETALGGIEEWEQLVGGQFYADIQRAIESDEMGVEAWVRHNGAWMPKRVGFAERLPKDILSPLRRLIRDIWSTLGEDDIFLVNGWMARRYEKQFVAPFGPENGKCGYAKALPADAVAVGAALFAERLAKGLPTFYDRIADYQYWDGFKTNWVQMFDGEQEVEPGHNYVYPETGQDPHLMKIEKFADNVSFYVRVSNDDVYARRIKTEFAEFIREEVELNFSAIVRPELGSARFVLSMNDMRARPIFLSGKTTVSEIVLRWSRELNTNNSVNVTSINEHQGYVEPQPVLGRIYDSENNLRMVEEYVKNPRGVDFARLWRAYNAQFHPRQGNGIADRVGYSAIPREPTRGLFGTRRVSNARIDAATYAYAKHCASINPFNTADGMKFQNYCHVSAVEGYKDLIRNALRNGETPQYNFNFYYAPGYVLGEDSNDIRILMEYIRKHPNLGQERSKLWWSFFRMLCWHPNCKLDSSDKVMLEGCLEMICDDDAVVAANEGRFAANDKRFLLLAILYALRIRESKEDLSDALKRRLITLLKQGELAQVSFPLTMVPRMGAVTPGDTLSAYVVRFIEFKDTLADRELGAAMGGV